MKNIKKKKKALLCITSNLPIKLLYYDRKECEDVSVDDISFMFKNGAISKKELVKAFSDGLDECLKAE